MASGFSPSGKALYRFLFILFLCIFLLCAGYLVSYLLRSQASRENYQELSQMVDELRPTVPTPSGPNSHAHLPDLPDTHDENGILLEYAPLAEQNPDMAGWLAIEGTDIHYPVMHAPDRKDYYLYRNFSGERSSWGCIYAQENCDLSIPSDNVILYGHNMKDGSMFAQLFRYTESSFRDDNPYIRFDTLSEHHVYEIFAVFITTASPGRGFPYYNFVQASDAAVFDEFIRNCRRLSLYDTGIVPNYGDKILCLSTCEYSQSNGRLVVAAVRIQ